MGKWTQSGLGSTAGNLTVTQSSVTGRAYVVTQLCAGITANSQANTAGSTYRTLAIQEGSTAGATLWQTRMFMQPSSGWQQRIILSGLWVESTTGAAIVASFTAAASTNTLYDISLTGIYH